MSGELVPVLVASCYARERVKEVCKYPLQTGPCDPAEETDESDAGAVEEEDKERRWKRKTDVQDTWCRTRVDVGHRVTHDALAMLSTPTSLRLSSAVNLASIYPLLCAALRNV